jgi:hypothetical protein
MAKLIFLVLAVGLFFSTTVTFIEKKTEKKSQEFKWEKPEKKFWLGNDYKSYTLDSANVLKISDDFVNWRKAKDTIWQDRFGRKISVYQNQLIWTINDMDWVDVPERTWQSIDGNWYKLDTNWQLWQSKVGSDRFSASY